MSENETTAPVPLEPSFRLVGDPAPLFMALATARPNFGTIARTKKVRVQPTTGPAYEFMYAPLESVIDATAPALAAEGLAMIQPCYAVHGGHEIRTILAHSSGSYLESIMFVSSTVHYFSKQDNAWMDRPLKIQELGSEITYKRRYSAQCVLGVNAEEDDDGNAADGNEVQAQAKSPPRSQPTPPAPKPQQRKPEPSKAPPVDPQMQADIDRRKANAPKPGSLAEHDANFRAASEPVSEKIEAGREALAEAEATAGVEPATPPAEPSWTTLADGHVPDPVNMPKGCATGQLIQELLKMRGFLFEGSENIAKTLSFIAEHTGGGNPQVKPLTYGQGRSVIRALEAIS